jgi:hypothetical protein
MVPEFHTVPKATFDFLTIIADGLKIHCKDCVKQQEVMSHNPRRTFFLARPQVIAAPGRMPTPPVPGSL